MGWMIDGLSQLPADLKRLAEKINMKPILEKAAQPILNQMEQNASSDPKPVTGALFQALKIRASGDKTATVGVHRRDWSNEDYYPAYVEYGHGGPRPAPAHPFIRPAFDAKQNEAYRIIKDELRKNIK